MRCKNTTPFLFGFKASSRKPPGLELTAIVRARLVLRPGEPALPCRSRAVDEDTLALFAEDDAAEVASVGQALTLLGQGSLSGDRFEADDDLCEGEVLYPSDFADFKPAAEVMLRGACYPGRSTSESTARFAVGAWHKELVVMGTRVRLDDTPAAEVTAPQPFTRMPIDYAHAYGGPGAEENPVGKGHLTASAEQVEAGYQPPRSERSRVMPSRQLPNVMHRGRKSHQGGLPAGFGPLNPRWKHRRRKLGVAYGDSWRQVRAPFPAADFDWSYMQAAPPDQVLPGYLRGDEVVRFTHLHPRAPDFAVTLPALRIRVFALSTDQRVTEVTMRLDTLFADVDGEALYLTWRGLTPVNDAQLRDVSCMLVVSEPLTEAPRAANAYHEQLRAFAADPLGLADVVPPEMAASREAVDRFEAADDAQLLAMLEHPDADEPIGAVLRHLGPATANVPTSDLAQAAQRAPQAALRRDVSEALRGARSSHRLGGPAGLRGETLALVGTLQRMREHMGQSPELEQAMARLEAEGGRHGGEQVSPGRDFSGQDLSGRDFTRQDLRGARFDGAVLDEADMSGAELTGASFANAQLQRTRLVEAELVDVDLSSATLDEVDARRANLSRARLDMLHVRRSTFDEATLTGATGELLELSRTSLLSVVARGLSLTRATFEECVLEDADLGESRLEATRFRACRAARLRLEASHLDGCGFKSCTLVDARFARAEGERTVWLEAELSGADFSLSRLHFALFSGARLEGASFFGADLRDARLEEACLQRATFSRSNLHGASLRGALIEGVSFSGASLYRADVSDSDASTCDFSEAFVVGARFDRTRGVNAGGRS